MGELLTVGVSRSTPEILQVGALIQASAAGLVMPRPRWERAYIDYRTNQTLGPMREVAGELGETIFGLMFPSALNPDGVSQHIVETLNNTYHHTDAIMARIHSQFWLQDPRNGYGYEPLVHVTARLGWKSTSHALGLWNNR